MDEQNLATKDQDVKQPVKKTKKAPSKVAVKSVSIEEVKRGRGRPRKKAVVPNPKFKNTYNPKIQLWNQILKENGQLSGGPRLMPKKGSKEYEQIRKIYDSRVVLLPSAPSDTQSSASS